MGLNMDIFFDFIGRLKLATVVVGVLNLSLIGSSYFHHDSRDVAFLSAVIICFVVSTGWVFGVIFEGFVVTDTFIRIDMVFHVIACLTLGTADVFFLISILKHSNQPEHFARRIFAMILGFINSALYGYLPWKLVKAG